MAEAGHVRPGVGGRVQINDCVYRSCLGRGMGESADLALIQAKNRDRPNSVLVSL